MGICGNIREKISSYIDNELRGHEREEFEGHISKCEICRLELDEMKRVIRMCNDGIEEEELPEGFEEILHSRLLSEKMKQTNMQTYSGQRVNKRYIKIIAYIACSFIAVVLISQYSSNIFSTSQIKSSNANVSLGEKNAEFDKAFPSGKKSYVGDDVNKSKEQQKIGDGKSTIVINSIDHKKDIDIVKKILDKYSNNVKNLNVTPEDRAGNAIISFDYSRSRYQEFISELKKIIDISEFSVNEENDTQNQPTKNSFIKIEIKLMKK